MCACACVCVWVCACVYVCVRRGEVVVASDIGELN